MLAEPYFAAPPPKSTGRELFNREWLRSIRTRANRAAPDVQATLTALTARSIALAVDRTAFGAQDVYRVRRRRRATPR